MSSDYYIESTNLRGLCTALELSKLHMYDFHDNHMCVKYPRANQIRLQFTDTGSSAYDVQTDDIYRDMADDAASRYDFSEYPLDHPFYDASNRNLDSSKMNWRCENLLDCVQNVTSFFVRVK